MVALVDLSNWNSVSIKLGGHKTYTNTSGMCTNLLGKFNIGQISSSSLSHDSGEDGEEGKVIVIDIRCIDGKTNISNSRGGLHLVTNNLNTGVIFILRDLIGIFRNLTLQISKLQTGDGGSIFRCILRCLQLLEFGSFLDYLINLIVSEGCLDGGKTALLTFQFFLLQSLGWLHLNSNTVLILNKVLLQKVGEDSRTVFGNGGLEFSQRLLETKSLSSISIVNPVGHGTQHEGKSLGVTSGIEFSQTELNGIHGRGNLII
mmetsp:Transcript_26528/g.39243  ORF Transcript_26528/g.39243 Transcript_26528/m.39243 type:complete len:260 (+) Transcript_26528:1117-1896(+)